MYKNFLIENNNCREAEMSVSNKKILSQIVYYTLAILTVLSSVFFVISLARSTVPAWARVVYFVWIGLVIGVIVFDIICTRTHESKFISGIIIYILSILSIIVPVLLYFMNSNNMGILPDFFAIFISVALMSFMTVGFMIATWIVGESIVEHETAENAIELRENN